MNPAVRDACGHPDLARRTRAAEWVDGTGPAGSTAFERAPFR
jgi:hypothetical protein